MIMRNQVSSAPMPSKKNRRQNAYPDWKTSDMDENVADSNSHIVADETIAENNQGRNETSNEGKISTSFKTTLGPWTFAVGEMLQSFDESRQKINNLQNIFNAHEKRLEKIDETARGLHQSEEKCRQKDILIEKQESTIQTLTRIQTKGKAQIELEFAQIEKEKSELKHEKEKQDKRLALVAAEEKSKASKELEKRKQDLEDDYTRKRSESETRAAASEAAKVRLTTTLNEREKKIKAQAAELEKIKEQYDVLERAKNSIRKEKLDGEAELEAIKREFTLKPRPLDYFMQNFAEIESQTERIAGKYFHSVERKDWQQIHKTLAAADPFFRFVPIDDSEDSRNLCAAHAQRIISKAICDDIWTPFSTEFTALQPELHTVLVKISDEIHRSDHGGPTATFWKARTVQALTSLSASSATSQNTKSMGYSRSARTDSIISKVFILSPLIDSSQEKSLRTKLVSLVESAVDIWYNGQAGGSNITVSLSLDRADREAWRSEMLDPAREGDGMNPDQTSTSHQIFPLFPRILAPGVRSLVRDGSGLPGSWPQDIDPTIIHPGKGLPEWSPLAVRGQRRQEETEEFLRTALESLKKQLQNPKRTSVSSRAISRDVTSGTPSEQWKREGAADFVEK